MRVPLLLMVAICSLDAQVLVPPYTNLALGKRVEASSTCGELNGQPIKEMFCQIAGSNQYTPLNQYSYSTNEDDISAIAELRMEKQSFVQGGQNCDFCQANTSSAHPAVNMVDGMATWWQSPPLSRGMQYNQVNITIDLEQEFHVAYVWIQMANSPRPGSWVLERSVDNGKTFQPWQYFAETPAECDRLFGRQTLQPITEDDTVICTHEYSGIHPMENAEIMINLLENRPGKHNFSHSLVLQNFARATNVRLRLLRTKTLHGHLMDVHRRNDPTVTRRYFYAIKEIFMGGRCVCNGHADTCDILDARRPRTLLCRCEHHTCGDHCERCCMGFEQKKWQRAKEGEVFVCEPCNCHGHSQECVYDEELDEKHLSLDINGKYEGGGRCLNCRDNTKGINCNECSFGFYRPKGKHWNETDVCQPCDCDPRKHTGACKEESGKCECQPRFVGEDCEFCARGYYSPPDCKLCDCSANGTVNGTCLPVDGQCPCKENYGGTFCNKCASGYTNLTAGCIHCNCDHTGSLNSNCSESTAQCVCKTNFAGLACDKCADGYYNHPDCEYCDCDASGTVEGICNKTSGICMCKPGFSGKRCDQCDTAYYGYPQCKKCDCNPVGSQALECDLKSGECPCYANFTGRECDRCAAGYYDYPNCKPCSCLISGSKGMTCDNLGQCYCKPNFQGERCDQCKTNFYNFPICEECNCNPSGVVASFAGCDKVAPGELCTCREHVTGRMCDQCKPTFWDLQYHHEKGCVSCDCYMPGTVSMLNVCGTIDGQCHCKRYASGRKCDKCAVGFYNLQSHNQLGCLPCECDIGGALGIGCNMTTGQCRCRPRITGKTCNRPIENHYFPTLWHHKYEAEDGVTPEQKSVRFATDAQRFPEFSSRGFAVFSPIQDEIMLEMIINRASLYRVLFHYMNPTPNNVDADVMISPMFTHTNDVDQSVRATFPPTEQPTTALVNKKQAFVLNPGRWGLSIKTKHGLFLDYVVLLPSEYYEATLLKERVTEPCKMHNSHNSTCLDLLYPPLPVASQARIDDGAMNEIDEDGVVSPLDKVPSEILPKDRGAVAFVKAGNQSRLIHIELEVPEKNDYTLLIEYYNHGKADILLEANLDRNNQSALHAAAIIRYCPYAAFCRELFSSNGSPAVFRLNKKKNFVITLSVKPTNEFGLASVNLIKATEWNNDYLRQVPVCIRKGGKCVDQWYPPAANAIVTEIESGTNENKSVSAAKLPFAIANAENVQVLTLDENQATIDVSGVVPARGHYMFIVHYFNPENTPFNVDVLLQNEQFYQSFIHLGEQPPSNAILPLSYCPSMSGCRSLIYDKDKPEMIQFWMEDRYIASFHYNDSQKGPLYIDSITAVPYQSFSESLMIPQPLDVSSEFIKECGENHFKNNPANVTDSCREKVFSLTAEFNMAALPCDCNPQGSKSFSCDEYGGQCQCKPNIIGRRCDRCAPGHYSFPDCIKCRCPNNHLCDEQSGQCYCPQYVEGKECDRCVPYAYGYDPLIGCQLCGCHRNGSEGGQLQCDPNNGQCLCKANVGGRKCDKCLPGYYGFSHCYECACEIKGTTEEVCDGTSAICKCKANVMRESCDTCRPGTFDLQASNPEGCSECFCFGATNRCQSSFFPVTFMGFDEEGWRITDPNGELSHSDGSIQYNSAVGNMRKNIYFLAPIVVGQDYTGSYGLQLSFIISSQPSNDSSHMSAAADVQLIGSNTTLEFWASEQPSDPKIPFRVNLKILPENLLTPSGEAPTRADVMLVLHDLKELRLKASYYEYCSSARISEILLEIARDDNQNVIDSSFTAASVELCHCPVPYAGPSCQYCAPGFHRVSSGRYLGACVPCECNGHSGSCDPSTGVCYDCQHDTYGEHCEFCREGFYGNATQGSPYSCLPCACPYPTATNNFAVSCQVSERGVLESCFCRTGYTGDRCDRCDTGYFGEPTRFEGKCEPCNCNDNNDLSVDGSCHPLTGDCDMCGNFSDGRFCEYCKQWYYGDAVSTKNCTECSCNHCGSSNCDNWSGKCNCHPHVVGENCDRCEADAWGFSRCNGCEICNCGLASASTQCDEENGQCLCMPGAAGRRCEYCEPGYWDYGPNGCKKCDCEADLSMGTVCDVATGKCHCQQGATGPRCDQCLMEYLRIPSYGCLLCDECVHSLNSDFEKLHASISYANASIGNVSTAVLTGARLRRIENRMEDMDPQLESLVLYESEIGIDNLRRSVDSRKAAATAVMIRANRSFDTLNSHRRRLDTIIEGSEKAAADVFNRVDVANWVMQSLRNLAISLGRDSSAVDRQKWVDASRSILEEIKDYPDRSDALRLVSEALTNATEVLSLVEGRRNQSEAQKESFLKAEERLNTLRNYTNDYENYLHNASNIVDSVTKLLNYLSMSTVTQLTEYLEKNEGRIAEDLKACSKLNSASTNLTGSIIGINETIKSLLDELNETTTHFVERINEGIRLGRGVQQAKYRKRLKEIEEEANRLLKTFENPKREAENALEAAMAYKTMLEALKAARELAEEAAQNANDAKESSDGQATSAKSVREDSAKLLRSAGDSRKKMHEASALKTVLEGKVAALYEAIVSQKANVGKVQKEMRDRKNSFREAVSAQRKVPAAIKEFTKKVKSSVDAVQPKLVELLQEIAKFVSESSNLSQDVNSARNQVHQLWSLSAPTVAELENLKNAASNTSASIMVCKDKINALKEKISLARDMANRIKLGAHFEKGSSLELPLPARVTRSAAYTNIEFFFRTTLHNGLMFYFGNEQGVAGTRAVPTDDYVAVEVEQGRARVVIDLGATPLALKSDTIVADGHWRKLSVERIGKSAVLRISVPNSSSYDEEKTGVVSGPKSVLNLHQKKSRLFIGGIPFGVNISSDVHSRDFIGDIEEVRIHGESIGLWNAKSGGSINVKGAEKRPPTTSVATDEIALSFDGQGYLVQNLGAWNPRKQTIFSLNFQTYSPDGLLFFVGKDRDFMSLELQDGAVKLSFDFGSGVGKLVSKLNGYNDGKLHSVYVSRLERHAKLQVDSDDSTEGDSPGTMFELSVTDVFYVGGVPTSVATRSAVVPLRGCVERVKLENDIVDLSKSKLAKGVQPGCPNRSVRLVSLVSERSAASFGNVSIKGDIELTLRFKTKESSGLLTSVLSDDQDIVIQIRLEDGFVVVECGPEGKLALKMELSAASDGQWHFIAVTKNSDKIRMDIDDLYSDERDFTDDNEEQSPHGSIYFGRLPESDLYLEGCIGDVTFNGQLLDFSDAVVKEVQLTGCSMPEEVFATYVPSAEVTTTKPRSVPKLNISLRAPTKEMGPNKKTPFQPPPFSVANVRASNECALLTRPHGPRDDSTGTRFGLTSKSRIEFQKPPGSFDRNSIFSVQLRATAANGIIMFAGSEKQVDHLALYLMNGIVHFAYNSGSGQAILKSNRSIMDDEWHSIRAEREGVAGALYIDDIMEANGQSPPGTDAIDTQPPIYIGGLSDKISWLAARALPGVKPVFGGCLRDFKLNDRKFDESGKNIDTVPCSQYTEPGLYFGQEGGYVILKEDLTVGLSFTIDLEVRPRVKTGVLLSVGVLEYLTLQFLNGTVKFTVDNGGGNESLSYSPSMDNALCDGHWHTIKLFKAKNLMVLIVDNKSATKIMKKGQKKDTNTKDPLYLGGVPKGTKPRGLDTVDGFVGCVRVTNLGRKPRKKKNIDLSGIPAFGDVERDICPVN